MPRKTWSNKRERQYEHVMDSARKRGSSTKRAKEIAARTERAHEGAVVRRGQGMNISGRSKMNKAQLQRAVDRRK
jgi:hypothetical protein